MPKDDDANALHLISDILDKLIDTQQANAETNAALRKSIEDLVREVEKVNAHFSNGFRSELKKHMEETIANYSADHDKTYGGDDLIDTIKDMSESVKDIQDTQHNWWHWIKHVGLIVVGFGTAIAATIKVVQMIMAAV